MVFLLFLSPIIFTLLISHFFTPSLTSPIIPPLKANLLTSLLISTFLISTFCIRLWIFFAVVFPQQPTIPPNIALPIRGALMSRSSMLMFVTDKLVNTVLLVFRKAPITVAAPIPTPYNDAPSPRLVSPTRLIDPEVIEPLINPSESELPSIFTLQFPAIPIIPPEKKLALTFRSSDFKSLIWTSFFAKPTIPPETKHELTLSSSSCILSSRKLLPTPAKAPTQLKELLFS